VDFQPKFNSRHPVETGVQAITNALKQAAYHLCFESAGTDVKLAEDCHRAVVAAKSASNLPPLTWRK
jgi:hypothetical protein